MRKNIFRRFFPFFLLRNTKKALLSCSEIIFHKEGFIFLKELINKLISSQMTAWISCNKPEWRWEEGRGRVEGRHRLFTTCYFVEKEVVFIVKLMNFCVRERIVN